MITRFSNKPVTLDNLRYGAMALLPNSILPLQVEDLKEKQAEAAQLLMDAGVPPLLTQGNELAGHTPFRQWDAAPERSAIPTEELPYATNPGRVITGEPMDIAFQLLKEESEGQLHNEDLFEGLLDEDDHMHYDEMNDKQRAIIDAKAALPSHLFTEGSEMGENMNPYLFSRSMHEKYPNITTMTNWNTCNISTMPCNLLSTTKKNRLRLWTMGMKNTRNIHIMSLCLVCTPISKIV